MDPEHQLADNLTCAIAGRSLSIVGNAASLLTGTYGPLIDSGCVLRLNAGIPVNRRAQGRRVDIHCFSTRPNFERNIRRARWRWLPTRGPRYFRNAVQIWMNPEHRELCDDPAQLFYPLTLWERLAERLGAPPSVGATTLNMIGALVPQAEVRVFGFDFKASTTFYRRRENLGPHDWAAERRFAKDLIEERGWTLFRSDSS